MLRQTFLHLPGVGPETEIRLWRMGVATWLDFQACSRLPARVARRRAVLSTHLDRSIARLDRNDAAFFNRVLPARERWRLYGDFRHNAAFIDIETSGLSPAYSYITMVGVLDSGGYRAYVRDENLEDLRSAMEQYDLIVTYNGAVFDVPWIEEHFGKILSRTAHVDLRFPLRRLGFLGGLKAIEYQAGLSRARELSGIQGADAVALWHRWRQGDRDARETLIRYNEADVVSLPVLADIAYGRLTAQLPIVTAPLEPWTKLDEVP